MSSVNLIITNLVIFIVILIISQIMKTKCACFTDMPSLLFYWNTSITAFSIMAIATVILQFNNVLTQEGPQGPQGLPGVSGDQGAPGINNN